MFSRLGSRRSLASPLLSIAIALAVVACGGAAASVAPSATPTPAATPTAAPTPSPTPVDVPAAFVRRIAMPDFSATAKITGSMTVGAIEGRITGDGVMDSGDSSSTMTIDLGTFKQETGTVRVGAKSWSRRSPGPWLEDPAKPAGSEGTTITDFLLSVASVEDLGLETRGGRQLHHLRSKAGQEIPCAALGFASDTAKDAECTLDLYATADGTPAIMAIAGGWKQVSGGVEVPATMTFELAFDDIGEPQAIEPPDDVWVRHTSTALGYTMARPADWTVEPAEDKDTYQVNGQPYIYVAVTPFKGSTAKFAAALKASYKEPFGGDPASETPTNLGGAAGVRLIYRYTTEQGQEMTLVDDAISRDGSGWEVFLVTDGGPEDIEVFDTFVATFAYVD